MLCVNDLLIVSLKNLMFENFYFLFKEYNLISTFLPSFSSLQLLPYTSSHTSWNSLLLFSGLVIIYCMHICINTYIPKCKLSHLFNATYMYTLTYAYVLTSNIPHPLPSNSSHAFPLCSQKLMHFSKPTEST